MARPVKQGLEYFSFDTDFFSDVKVRRISRACGPASTSILICLLCNIYRDKGYYIRWDENLPFVVADTIGTTEGAVEEVVKKAIQVEFFDKELFEKHKILTSNGIQNRFRSAVVRREEIEYVVDYLVSERKNEVIACKNEVIACKNEVIADRSTQSKVKVKRKKNNTPSPPLKGGGKRRKRESKEINSKARFLFEEYFKKTFFDSYYWTAKDAGNMSQLLQKLIFSREQKQMPVDDASVLYALQVFLSSVKDGWLLENFSVANLNSKYNEIIAQAKNGNNRKPDTKPDESSAGIKSIVFGKQS